ncbi:hypothetical protein AMTR_s00040p00231720 [Amborella trichopoda]|uniref:Uncharacterized protein n=1 Tax=Amborella trichopoda TaxID=13333 RepID=W1Q037_AMBTC|nr:hypothetical protein AMTR_s00040p00231720 [Amborella trichopoda]
MRGEHRGSRFGGRSNRGSKLAGAREEKVKPNLANGCEDRSVLRWGARREAKSSGSGGEGSKERTTRILAEATCQSIADEGLEEEAGKGEEGEGGLETPKAVTKGLDTETRTFEEERGSTDRVEEPVDGRSTGSRSRG